jgi:transcriptional regulator with XRE-family HTH domain
VSEEIEVGKRIAHWRVWRSWTPQDLAKAVGVTPAAVYQWEGTGESKVRPSLEKLEKVVDALGITMARFWGPLPKLKAAS